MFHSLDQVVERLKQGRRFLVIGHIGPDGDDVSCVASLVMILRKAGKTTEGCIADRVPDFLGGEPPDITIDHHKTNAGFGAINFCDSSYAAAAMIAQEIGERLVELDSALAELLLLGIATDTGFFRYTSVNERVFESAAALVRQGANIGRIAEAVLEHRTLSEIQLHKDMLETLKLSVGGKLASAHVTADVIERNGCRDEDTFGLVSELRAIGGVEVAIVFVEWARGTVNASLRSKNRVDVSQIALRFGGGGHVPAAGFSQSGVDIADLMADVLADAERTLGKAFPREG